MFALCAWFSSAQTAVTLGVAQYFPAIKNFLDKSWPKKGLLTCCFNFLPPRSSSCCCLFFFNNPFAIDIAVLVLIFNAAKSCPTMPALFSDHTFRHYAYLRDSLSHLVPPLRVSWTTLVWTLTPIRSIAGLFHVCLCVALRSQKVFLLCTTGINIEMCVEALETDVKLLQYGICNILRRTVTSLLSGENSTWFAGSVRILGGQYSWEFSVPLSDCVGGKSLCRSSSISLVSYLNSLFMGEMCSICFATCFSCMEVWL